MFFNISNLLTLMKEMGTSNWPLPNPLHMTSAIFLYTLWPLLLSSYSRSFFMSLGLKLLTCILNLCFPTPAHLQSVAMWILQKNTLYLTISRKNNFWSVIRNFLESILLHQQIALGSLIQCTCPLLCLYLYWSYILKGPCFPSA